MNGDSTGVPPPLRLTTVKELKMWPRAELADYYAQIGRFNPTTSARLDDVRVVQVQGEDVWIEVTTTRIDPVR